MYKKIRFTNNKEDTRIDNSSTLDQHLTVNIGHVYSFLKAEKGKHIVNTSVNSNLLIGGEQLRHIDLFYLTQTSTNLYLGTKYERDEKWLLKGKLNLEIVVTSGDDEILDDSRGDSKFIKKLKKSMPLMAVEYDVDVSENGNLTVYEKKLTFVYGKNMFP